MRFHGNAPGWRFAIGGCLAVAAMCLAACGSSSGGSSGGGSAATGSTAAPAKKAVIAGFVVDMANPYETGLVSGEKNEAAAQGASITMFGAKSDPQVQVGQCQDALSTKKYNVFLIKAVNGATMVPCARQAIAQGIKVVAVDTPLGAKYTLKPQLSGIVGSVVSLPTTQGNAGVTEIVEACKSLNPCKVAYYYGPLVFSFPAAEKKVVLDGLAKHPNIKVVSTGTWNYDPDQATHLAQQLLTTHPDVNVVASDGDVAALNAMRVFTRAGHGPPKVQFVGGGGSIVGSKSIEAGKLFGTSAQFPATMGKRSVDLGIKALNNKPLGQTQYDAAYLTPLGPVITKKNVAQFHGEWGG